MKIPIKIDGKQYFCPSTWKDVTVNQFLELKEWRNRNQGITNLTAFEMIKFYSIFTKVPYDILNKTRNVEIDILLAPYLAFAKDEIKENKTETLTIGTEKYKVPVDIGKHSFGQKIAATNAVNKAIKEHNDAFAAMSDVVAIYLHPIVTKEPFDEDKALQYAKDVINECSVEEVYSIGAFFLRSLMQLERKRQKRSRLNPIKNKWLVGLLNWMSSKKSTLLMLWLVAMFLNGNQ